MSFFSNITVHVQRVYGPEAAAPGQIGKYVVAMMFADRVFDRTTARCVVDDFGNLVAVPA